MRTIIDLPAEQLQQLAALCDRQSVSRAEAIRRAVALLLAREQTTDSDAFGLWKDREIDGLDHQRQMRNEWQA